jgi:hypothetical protein
MTTNRARLALALALVASGCPAGAERPASGAEAARAEVRRMCDKLLANPVTEDYQLEIEG